MEEKLHELLYKSEIALLHVQCKLRDTFLEALQEEVKE